MNKRPYFTKTHMILEILSWVICLAALIIAIVGAMTIDGEIATHFDMHGNPDSYGTAKSLITLPVVMMIIGLGTLSFVGHFMDPSTWNMPFKVNPMRKYVVYKDMLNMTYILALLISLITLYLTLTMFFQNTSSMFVVMILFIVLISADIVVWCVLASRHNKM